MRFLPNPTTALLLTFLALASAGCAAPSDGPPEDVEAAEDDLTAVQTAGAYQKLGFDKANGEISQVLLLPDRSFVMDLKGEFGCDVYAGYSCPSSWNDGRVGVTIVRGSWKATTRGLVLQPTGEGRPSAPIPMTVTRTGTKATFEGKIVPNRRVFGELDVIGLFGKPHTVKAEQLHGTWKVTSPKDKDGFQPKIDGTNLYVGPDQEHILTFRESGTFVDDRIEVGKASRRKKDDGRYWVAGAPDGKGAGVLLFEWAYVFSDARIRSLVGDVVTFEVDPGADGRTLEAKKRP